MNTLFVLDKKNYTSDMPLSFRQAARAIIFAERSKLLMVKSLTEGYFKFPGGGVKEGESLQTALKREAEEEAGVILSDSLTEFGSVLEMRKISNEKGIESIFHHTSFYFICKIDRRTAQKLEQDEQELQFVPQVVSIEEAIMQNKKVMNKYYSTNIIRETKMLELLKKEYL